MALMPGIGKSDKPSKVFKLYSELIIHFSPRKINTKLLGPIWGQKAIINCVITKTTYAQHKF